MLATDQRRMLQHSATWRRMLQLAEASSWSLFDGFPTSAECSILNFMNWSVGWSELQGAAVMCLCGGGRPIAVGSSSLAVSRRPKAHGPVAWFCSSVQLAWLGLPAPGCEAQV
jgi:hypothetical protein